MSELKESPATKHCVACHAAIDRRASKCPHCQSYQGWLRTAIFSALIIGAVLLLVLVVVSLVVHFGLAQRVFVDATNYANQVSIESAEMFIGPLATYHSEDGERVSIVGRLTNRSGKVLASVRLQVEVHSSGSRLIDTFEDTASGPLGPGDSLAFRIDSHNRIHLPKSEYVDHRVIVLRARAAD